jgi:rhodanese-related sulfurtransferase
MGRINLMGPPPPPEPALVELEPAVVERMVAAGEAHLVDIRPVADYAAGHVPGSLGVELDAELGTWVGWLLPYDSPLVLLVGEAQDPRAAVAELARVGFDHVVGTVTGVEAWAASGRPLRSFATADVAAFAEAVASGAPVLDVRSPPEWELGTVPGSVHRHLPDLAEGLPAELAGLPPGSEVWIGCTSGQRAAVAAGLLEERGLRPVVLAESGLFAVALELRKRAAVTELAS